MANRFPCPICNSPTRVYDTRPQGGFLQRRRRCENGHRFNTSERVMSQPWSGDGRLAVVPNDEESYNRLEADLKAERGWE